MLQNTKIIKKYLDFQRYNQVDSNFLNNNSIY